ncbi:DUF3152 domain-containing protein [Kineosporia sp. NBRC 101731]|uniref:DUF3152 domain-containing protein n=1 Tax=Kineosporia sp. NBRC 101731 TaxID=3032199 RepID=UPI0024A0596E|nr:DUF3152 domain-containing protein [Kineosporia sp. NBRC 101731]GLY28492.1 hypothetical protein Kisp02_18570 [Kineosporia sp. NBRC 101731]
MSSTRPDSPDAPDAPDSVPGAGGSGRLPGARCAAQAHDLAVRGRSAVLPVVLVVMALALAGCSGSSEGTSATASTTSSSTSSSNSATTATPPTPATPTTTGTAAGESDTTSTADDTADLPKGLTEADVEAGLTSAKVKWKASGTLRTVKGTAKAPGQGKVYKVRVQVEKGVAIDGEKFADFVLATLNDDRSWTEDGTRRFARTDKASEAFTTVTLASPETSASMCLPLKTFGKLSCRNGGRVVLTTYRWTKAIPEYKKDRTGYRHYVVNHEVGHALGHGHEYCAGRGKRAPLMMQQTKGLLGCRPNPWPHP